MDINRLNSNGLLNRMGGAGAPYGSGAIDGAGGISSSAVPMQTADGRTEPAVSPAPVKTDEDAVNGAAILQRYRSGKANLENRIVENEKWYKLQQYNGSKGRRKATAWLFNALHNKHADFMDNVPAAEVLPREEGDRKNAEILSDILPVILERCEWPRTYSNSSWYKLKHGGAVYSVLWDKDASGGIGDIAVTHVDALNIFWEPGIKNIQDSKNVFHIKLVDNEVLEADYPQLKGRLGKALSTTEYIHDEAFDSSDKTYLVDWYYKKRIGGRSVLHYIKMCNGVLLFASENDERYSTTGWYNHGKYPFVFDSLFPDTESPFGIGYIDLLKDTVKDLDEIDTEVRRAAKLTAHKRYFVRDDGSVNLSDYADLDKDLVPVAGNPTDDNVREIPQNPISDSLLATRQNLVDELKEVSSNRDFSSGGTSGSVTAASAIAALQEAGNKTSRDMIHQSYTAFADINTFCIELIRQFYDAPRSFRIVGDNGQASFTAFDNRGIKNKPMAPEFGVDFGAVEPVFDVSVRAFKSNPFSRAAQNQDAMNMYSGGFFNPENDVASLAALKMMDFENKDMVVQLIEKNGKRAKLLEEIIPLLLQVCQIADAAGGGQTQYSQIAANMVGMNQNLIDTAAMQQNTGADGTNNIGVGDKRMEKARASSAVM